MRFFKRKKDTSKTDQAAIKKWVTEYEDEETKKAEKERALKAFNKKFKLYIILSVLYGLVFVNYIDNTITSGGFAYSGYHLWLTIIYFFPFIILTITFPRNWQLTIGLGLLASLMNDVFYGMVRSLMGSQIDLVWYYKLWLIPSGTLLFNLNLGVVTIPVYSWLMALTIYARIAIVIVLLWRWKQQAKVRYLSQPMHEKKNLISNWWKKQLKNRVTKPSTPKITGLRLPRTGNSIL
ncbi:MAG: hypothetical protein NWE93_11045 [Candidatus Bathyarchaeota archaeon]|nr:hypothetical protein [Candidatus Bathyarchaeota archaeon]